ncbi:MAG: metalloregulator ArsR/SmtB family transcription factor [Deltaproteobacteria bacterium]|nr:metalloregulator ArsR/SmtB family transcription factor [Deltaproteobacteria bacterium]
MKKESRFFKGLADETRLKILWLLMQRDELCVCDIMRVLGITQSKASRHLRYLSNLGVLSDRREGVWMNYRLSVAPGSPEARQLHLLADMLRDHPEARSLQTRLAQCIAAKERSGRPAADLQEEARLLCQ